MRRIRILLWSLAVAAVLGAAPVHATSVTVVMTGTWYFVDDGSALDGSVTEDGTFTVTLVYDDTVADSEGSPSFGAYFGAAASTDLTIVTGNYSFSPSTGVDIGVQNDIGGPDVTFFDAYDYVVSGPGVETGDTAYVNASLASSAGTAHSSDALIGLNWELSDFDFSDVYLFAELTEQGPLEFAGTIDSIQVLPEPSFLGLAGLACAGVIAARRRG